MQATVISVQPNVTKQGRSGPYTVHIFTYQPDPVGTYGAKPPTTRDIFTDNRANPQVPIAVMTLQVGQRVELTFTPQAQNPQYKDLTDVQVIAGAAPPAPPVGQPAAAPVQQSEPTPPLPYQKPVAPVATPVAPVEPYVDTTQISIERQVGIKAGVEMVKTLLGKDKYYAAKIKRELLAEDVVFYAREFEAYIQGATEKFDPDQGLSNDLPEPPFNPGDNIPPNNG